MRYFSFNHIFTTLFHLKTLHSRERKEFEAVASNYNIYYCLTLCESGIQELYNSGSGLGCLMWLQSDSNWAEAIWRLLYSHFWFLCKEDSNNWGSSDISLYVVSQHGSFRIAWLLTCWLTIPKAHVLRQRTRWNLYHPFDLLSEIQVVSYLPHSFGQGSYKVCPTPRRGIFDLIS